MSLTKIIKKYEMLGVLGLAGVLSLPSYGCTGNMRDIRALGLALRVAAACNANREAKLQAERDERITANAYPGGQVQRRNPVAFTCNAWADLNGDGKSSPDEYRGVKKVFKRDEQICIIGVLNNSYQPVNLDIIILDLDEKRLCYRQEVRQNLPSRHLVFKPGTFKSGEYRAAFNLGYTQTSCDFEVVD